MLHEKQLKSRLHFVILNQKDCLKKNSYPNFTIVGNKRHCLSVFRHTKNCHRNTFRKNFFNAKNGRTTNNSEKSPMQRWHETKTKQNQNGTNLQNRNTGSRLREYVRVLWILETDVQTGSRISLLSGSFLKRDHAKKAPAHAKDCILVGQNEHARTFEGPTAVLQRSCLQ